jgi:threonine/homoserine/homoserine lactone efflux protein
MELLLPFIIATSVFAFIPGPGMFYMSIQTMTRGSRAGWLSAVGFHLGAYVHIFAASFGVTVILEAIPTLFVALKLLGAVYLIWMGVRMFRDGERHQLSEEVAPRRSAWQAFKDSLAVELLNPKTALFFLAFLPQFTSADASLPVWIQIVILGTMANVCFSVTDVICVVFSEKLAVWVATSRNLVRIGRQAGGSIFIAMGLRLAL